MTVYKPVQEDDIVILDDFSQRLKKNASTTHNACKCFLLKMKSVCIITFKRSMREQKSQFVYFFNKAF